MTLDPRKDEPQQAPVLEPTAVDERLGPILMEQWRRVLPLLVLGDDRRIDAKGTGTLVKLRGQPLVVTAAHVGGISRLHSCSHLRSVSLCLGKHHRLLVLRCFCARG